MRMIIIIMIIIIIIIIIMIITRLIRIIIIPKNNINISYNKKNNNCPHFSLQNERQGEIQTSEANS